MQGGQSLTLFLSEGLTCQVRLPLCQRTCCNTTFNSGRRSRNSGSWGMIVLGKYAFWPYMHREILNKAKQCKPCNDIGMNLKSVTSASKWQPLLNCSEPNEEKQIDFGDPTTKEKDQVIYFFACIDHFSKYPTVEVFDKANGKLKISR